MPFLLPLVLTNGKQSTPTAAIKSNVACLDSCRWLKPTAINQMFRFELQCSIRPEIFNSDFIVRAFSIAVGFNQRQTTNGKQPTANNQRQTINGKQPMANNQRQH